MWFRLFWQSIFDHFKCSIWPASFSDLIFRFCRISLPLSCPRAAVRWGCLRPLPACEVRPIAEARPSLPGRSRCRRQSTWRPPAAEGCSRPPEEGWPWSAEAGLRQLQVEGLVRSGLCLNGKQTGNYLLKQSSNYEKVKMLESLINGW